MHTELECEKFFLTSKWIYVPNKITDKLKFHSSRKQNDNIAYKQAWLRPEVQLVTTMK